MGEGVFLGSLLNSCPDALTVGAKASSGGSSYVYPIDAEGVVRPVVIGDKATVGNSAVLYGGCRLGESSLVSSLCEHLCLRLEATADWHALIELCGALFQCSSSPCCLAWLWGAPAHPATNDTSRPSHPAPQMGNDTVVAAGVVLPPRARLQGGVRYTVDPSKDPEAAAAAGGAAPAAGSDEPPRFHTARMVAAELLTQPIAPMLRYSLPSFILVLVIEAGGGWGAFLYLGMLGFGTACVTAWLRLLPSLVGMHGLWAAGFADVWSVAAAVCHSECISLVVSAC